MPSKLFTFIFKPFIQTSARQEKVENQIKENAKPDFDFYVLITTASLIVSLGILIDSTAVVIGGMLIAPLVWPIMALSLGLVTNSQKLTQKSIITILKNTVLVIFISLVCGLIVPDLMSENNEFLTRTSPTLFELIIGLIAGFTGAFIITYPKIGSAIAGVVIAAAIVPPLATIGISISRMDYNATIGALLLFLSNLVAISAASTLLFIISGFKKSKKGNYKLSQLLWNLVLLIIIFIPLLLTTQKTINDTRTKKIIKDVVTSSLDEVIIDNIAINQKDDFWEINLVLNHKQTFEFSQAKAIENIISKRLNKPVSLKLKIIPLIEVNNQLEENKKKANDFDETNYIECPTVINGVKIPRIYPKKIGCPLCLDIISCWDGREFPNEKFNEKTGLCEKIDYPNDPCVKIKIGEKKEKENVSTKEALIKSGDQIATPSSAIMN